MWLGYFGSKECFGKSEIFTQAICIKFLLLQKYFSFSQQGKLCEIFHKQ